MAQPGRTIGMQATKRMESKKMGQEQPGEWAVAVPEAGKPSVEKRNSLVRRPLILRANQELMNFAATVTVTVSHEDTFHPKKRNSLVRSPLIHRENQEL
jgi:hypothetical protein